MKPLHAGEVILCLLFTLTPLVVDAFYNRQPAALVVGQPDFTHNGIATTATGTSLPYAVAFDKAGNLWVADAANNRVIEFAKGTGFTNGQAASVVLGQADFTHGGAASSSTGMYNPNCVSVDSSGNVWVADTSNNRVLEFKPPFTNGMAASIALGQTDFTQNGTATTSTGLNAPTGVAFDPAGDLWVADYSNSRVIEFAPPFANGEAASVVLGQPDFVHNAATTTSTGMNEPFGLKFDSHGNLWVADYYNNRVLEFKPPFTNGEAASTVLGQPDFTSAAFAATSQTFMNTPAGVAFDSSGNLWVTDSSNNRVLEFAPPFANDEAASLVLGQSDFFGYLFYTSSTGMNYPYGIVVDSSGDVWVADTSNNRVLEFKPPLTNDEAASLVLGKPDFVHAGPPLTSKSLWGPFSATVDQLGNLWVADYENNRVLEFAKGSGFTNGQAASLVLGQPDFTQGGPATTSTGLRNPTQVAVDPLGNVWVADNFNHRVLEFTPPFTNGQAATLVLGQPDFTHSAMGSTSSGVAWPIGLAVDRSGDVWVVDAGNNRIVEFKPPFTTGEAASLVLGQPDFAHNGVATTSTGLWTPYGAAFDSLGNLWVTDAHNNRVVEFVKGAGFIDGQAASVVLGQPDFTHNAYATTSTGMFNPNEIAIDPSGNVWVADTSNSRVLEFTPPFTNGQAASLVLGQADFTHNAPATASAGVSYPTGVAADPSGAIWVADIGNNRVLEFLNPASSATSLSCAPTSFAMGSTSTCTATVTGNLPTGNVTFSQSEGTGTITFRSGNYCSLTAGGACSIVVTGADPGSVTLRASYGGDSRNGPSSGTTNIPVLAATSTTTSTSITSATSGTSSTTTSATTSTSTTVSGTTSTTTSAATSSTATSSSITPTQPGPGPVPTGLTTVLIIIATMALVLILMMFLLYGRKRGFTVTVLDSKTSSPIIGAIVSAEGPRNLSGTTGKDGKVTFGAVKEDGYLVKANAAGYSPSIPAKVSVKRRTEYTVRLDPIAPAAYGASG